MRKIDAISHLLCSSNQQGMRELLWPKTSMKLERKLLFYKQDSISRVEQSMSTLSNMGIKGLKVYFSLTYDYLQV